MVRCNLTPEKLRQPEGHAKHVFIVLAADKTSQRIPETTLYHQQVPLKRCSGFFTAELHEQYLHKT